MHGHDRRDAREHGVVVRLVDVAVSDWRPLIEEPEGSLCCDQTLPNHCAPCGCPYRAEQSEKGVPSPLAQKLRDRTELLEGLRVASRDLR